MDCWNFTHSSCCVLSDDDDDDEDMHRVVLEGSVESTKGLLPVRKRLVRRECFGMEGLCTILEMQVCARRLVSVFIIL